MKFSDTFKTNLILLGGFIVVCFLVVGILSIPSVKASENGKAYEYKFDNSGSEKKANELGAQGWELIAIQSTGPGLANNVPTYVFKREKK